MSIIERINNLDPRIIFTLVFLTTLYPLLFPSLLSFETTAYTEMYWDFIQEIPEGSIVGWQNMIDAATDNSLRSGTVLTLVELFEKDCKVITFSLRAWSPPLSNAYLKQAEGILGRDLVNGVDYIELGYIPGEETGLSALLSDIPSYINHKDRYGNDISEMSIMNGIVTGADIKYILWAGADGGGDEYAVRQWRDPFECEMTSISASMTLSQITPYFPTGQIRGSLVGLRGSAEIEYLTQTPGLATGQTLATSYTSIMFLIILATGNLLFLFNKPVKEQ